jgi:hypothetical protein
MNITKCIFLISAFFAFTLGLNAQTVSNSQLWTDFLVDVPFGKNLFETEFSYQTLLNANPKIDRWVSLNLTPAYERAESKYFDIITSLNFSYTRQNDSVNSMEIRPMVGVRLYFTPDKRLQTRLSIRYEHRFFKDLGAVGWQNATRTRIRPELIFPINKRSYFVNKMLYVLTDVEFFVSLDKDVNEAFANRVRNRLGLGYRFSYNFRLEGIYTLQRSKNEITHDYDSWDNIFRIRFKMYLPLKHPLLSFKKEGNGN